MKSISKNGIWAINAYFLLPWLFIREIYKITTFMQVAGLPFPDEARRQAHTYPDFTIVGYLKTSCTWRLLRTKYSVIPRQLLLAQWMRAAAIRIRFPLLIPCRFNELTKLFLFQLACTGGETTISRVNLSWNVYKYRGWIYSNLNIEVLCMIISCSDSFNNCSFKCLVPCRDCTAFSIFINYKISFHITGL